MLLIGIVEQSVKSPAHDADGITAAEETTLTGNDPGCQRKTSRGDGCNGGFLGRIDGQTKSGAVHVEICISAEEIERASDLFLENIIIYPCNHVPASISVGFQMDDWRVINLVGMRMGLKGVSFSRKPINWEAADEPHWKRDAPIVVREGCM